MKQMLFASALSAFVLIGAIGVHAQASPPPPKDVNPEAAPNPCPQISLVGPGNRIVKDGESIGVNANVNGGVPTTPANFVWSTSAGVITAGQSTRNITIDTTGAGGERDVRVELWVSGYPVECSLQAAANFQVVPPARKVLEFPELTPEKEAHELKSVAAAVANSPDNVYVFAYAGKETVRGYASAALKRIKATLIENGLAYQRLGFIDGGYRERAAFEIWIVPVGADVPHSSPTLSVRDVTFTKPVPAPSKKP